MYNNFGEIGANIKTMVDSYQEKSKSHAKIESIADMKVRCNSSLEGATELKFAPFCPS